MLTITLSPATRADAPDVLEAVRESLAELSPWMPWSGESYSLESADEWTVLAEEGRRTGASFEFVIRDAGGRLLGCCGLNQVRTDNRFANLGYWVRSSETGRGVAPAAVRLLVRWGFDNTDLERFEIMSALENVRSQHVAQAAGAWREGVLRSRLLLHGRFHDAVMYSIVRSQWPPA